MEQSFKFKEATLKRCKVVELDEKQILRFAPISLEFFHFLYQAKSIDFSIYFRAQNKAVEYLKPSEYGKQLLDEMWEALQKSTNGLEVWVLKSEKPKFDHLVELIRTAKLDGLKRKFPNLDQKTLDLYTNLSSASQMIVSGGIDKSVAAKVKASAAYMVSNVIDSETAMSTLSRMIICDPTLYDHSATVAMIATMIGQRIIAKPFSVKDATVLSQCALYHDVGKTCVPNCILNKPGKFTDEEFAIMKTHTTLGHQELVRLIQEGMPIDDLVARTALEHHEKWNGKGYPLGKRGAYERDQVNGIHIYSRIVTIADIYSALLMKRVYKPAFEPQDAIKIMANERDGFDPEIFLPFLKTVVNSLNAEAKGRSKGRILHLDEKQGLSEWSDPKKPN